LPPYRKESTGSCFRGEGYDSPQTPAQPATPCVAGAVEGGNRL
jgi:hypothetical protein